MKARTVLAAVMAELTSMWRRPETAIISRVGSRRDAKLKTATANTTTRKQATTRAIAGLKRASATTKIKANGTSRTAQTLDAL